MTIITVEKKVDQTSAVEFISRQWKGVLSEFVSTFILINLGCMSTIPHDAPLPNSPLYSPIAFGLTVMFNIQIFGHISGAFMNPFVTIIAAIWGKISIMVTVLYIVAQCAGAILGYGLLTTLAPIDIAADGVCMTLPNGINEFQALGVEMLITLALSLINCAIWDPVNAHNTDAIPVKFGLSIIGLSLIGGPLTGASMNPARSLGPAVWTNNWDYHWIYWVGPMVGGILPAIFYKYVWLKKTEA